MRRFLHVALIILALFASAMGAAPTAFAEEDRISSTDAWVQNGMAPQGDEINSADYWKQSGMPQQDPVAAKTVTDHKPDADAEANGIMGKIASLFAWLLGVAAIVLDTAVFYTVVTMGDLVKNLSAIGVTWSIARDIGNIVLIFGFLAIGISIILSTERIGYGKQMLPKLLAAAVFINFSFFISAAVIDTGNLFATQFYKQINGGEMAGNKTFDKDSFYRVSEEGISNKIMGQLRFAKIYGEAINKSIVFEGANALFIGFMSIILFITAAFVMFSLAFILVARFVILIYLIILAPIGFAGLAVPKLASSANDWWHRLFNETLTAPILMLLLYIALAVITDDRFLTGFGSDQNSSWTGFVDGNLDGFASMMISFIVAMGLLIAVTIIAKQMSAFGASGAMKWGSKLSGAALFAGGVGVAGRYAFGAPSKSFAKGLRNTGFGRTFAGRAIADKLDKVSSSSFDVRNTEMGKKVSGYGLDMGDGQKGGYKGAIKERAESYERAREGITGDREKTKAERGAISDARAKTSETGKTHSEAQKEHEKYKAEVERLEKSTIEYPGKQAELDTARANLSASSSKISQTGKAHEDAVNTTKKLIESTRTATSEKGRKEQYQKNLESWGNLEVLGLKVFGNAAAREAAKKHVKKEQDKKSLDGAIKAFMKQQENEEAKNNKHASAESAPSAPSSNSH